MLPLVDGATLNAPETVMTTAEAAKMLKITERTVREMANRGEIPARQVGRQWRFSAIRIHQWLGPDDGDGRRTANLVHAPESQDIREWARQAIDEHRPVYEELARR